MRNRWKLGLHNQSCLKQMFSVRYTSDFKLISTRHAETIDIASDLLPNTELIAVFLFINSEFRNIKVKNITHFTVEVCIIYRTFPLSFQH